MTLQGVSMLMLWENYERACYGVLLQEIAQASVCIRAEVLTAGPFHLLNEHQVSADGCFKI